jgi:2-polyprenyl-3-methyl-5-hydroxy-6-metoxy-1,4-benzoquinol methylase
MGRLRDTLIERYAEHYAAANDQVDPRRTSARELQGRSATLGSLLCGLPDPSRILDLGCGTGKLMYWLEQQPGIVPAGVDLSASQIEVARRGLPEFEIACENGLDYLRRYPNTFRGIFCMDLLEHIPDEDECLEWVETAREALLPGGFFCCRSPNAASLISNHSRYLDLTHVRCFTRTSMLALLDAAGLADCRVVPIRTGHALGHLRQRLDTLLHRLVFRLAGRPTETVFTSNICAVGFRPTS